MELNMGMMLLLGFILFIIAPLCKGLFKQN